jgi:hypothetical protein
MSYRQPVFFAPADRPRNPEFAVGRRADRQIAVVGLIQQAIELSCGSSQAADDLTFAQQALSNSPLRLDASL